MTTEQEAFYYDLMTQNYPAISHYIYGMTNDTNATEDLTVDTFHEAFLQIDHLMEHEAPKLWLYRTAKYKTMNYCSQRNRDAMHNISMDSEAAQPLPGQGEASIRASTLLAAMQQVLSKEDFELFILHIQGIPFHDLADRFGTTAPACRKRVQRIREKLRKELF